MPSDSTGTNWKLARPYHGPYRVLQVTPTNAEMRLVDQPKGDSLHLSGYIDVILSREMKHGQDEGNFVRSCLVSAAEQPSLLVVWSLHLNIMYHCYEVCV